MQANLNRRLSHGLLFGVAYTWSKSMDFGSDQSYQLPDYYNPSIELRSQRFRYSQHAGRELRLGHPLRQQHRQPLRPWSNRELAALGHHAGAVGRAVHA